MVHSLLPSEILKRSCSPSPQCSKKGIWLSDPIYLARCKGRDAGENRGAGGLGGS